MFNSYYEPEHGSNNVRFFIESEKMPHGIFGKNKLNPFLQHLKLMALTRNEECPSLPTFFISTKWVLF